MTDIGAQPNTEGQLTENLEFFVTRRHNQVQSHFGQNLGADIILDVTVRCRSHKTNFEYS